MVPGATRLYWRSATVWSIAALVVSLSTGSLSAPQGCERLAGDYQDCGYGRNTETSCGVLGSSMRKCRERIWLGAEGHEQQAPRAGRSSGCLERGCVAGEDQAGCSGIGGGLGMGPKRCLTEGISRSIILEAGQIGITNPMEEVSSCDASPRL